MDTVAGKQPSSSTNFNLRAYIAGGAATVALIAAGVVVFGSLAAYVAFNGLPVGGGDHAGSSVAVQANASAGASAPANAAATFAATPAAVAATAAAATAVAPAPGTIAGDGGGAGTQDAGTTGAGDVTSPTTVPPPTDTQTPPATAPSAEAPAATGPGSGASGSGAVGNTVQGVEDVAGNAGVDLPLSDATDNITAPIDDTVNGTLDDVGGAVDGLLGN